MQSQNGGVPSLIAGRISKGVAVGVGGSVLGALTRERGQGFQPCNGTGSKGQFCEQCCGAVNTGGTSGVACGSAGIGPTSEPCSAS